MAYAWVPTLGLLSYDGISQGSMDSVTLIVSCCLMSPLAACLLPIPSDDRPLEFGVLENGDNLLIQGCGQQGEILFIVNVQRCDRAITELHPAADGCFLWSKRSGVSMRQGTQQTGTYSNNFQWLQGEAS